MGKLYAESRISLNILVGVSILLNWISAGYGLIFLLASPGWSWQILVITISAYCLKIVGLFKIWKESKSAIMMLAVGILILVVLRWPLSFEDQIVQLMLLDVAILILALWSFRKPEPKAEM